MTTIIITKLCKSKWFKDRKSYKKNLSHSNLIWRLF